MMQLDSYSNERMWPWQHKFKIAIAIEVTNQSH